jgi:hypothetical protein
VLQADTYNVMEKDAAANVTLFSMWLLFSFYQPIPIELYTLCTCGWTKQMWQDYDYNYYEKNKNKMLSPQKAAKNCWNDTGCQKLQNGDTLEHLGQPNFDAIEFNANNSRMEIVCVSCHSVICWWPISTGQVVSTAALGTKNLRQF